MVQQGAISRIRKDDRPGRLSHEYYTRAPVKLDHIEAPEPSTEATFEWVVRPADRWVECPVYPDGSRLDGPGDDLACNG